MVVHELLFVLAGFGSNVIGGAGGQTLLNACHPSERSLLERAYEFGERHARLKDLCSRVRNADQKGRQTAAQGYSLLSYAVMRAVEKDLNTAFAEELQQVEADILKKNSAYVGGDNMVPITLIMSNLVGGWEQRFKYGEQVMTTIVGVKQKAPKAHEILNMLQDHAIKHIGEVGKLAHSCLIAAQKSWIHDVSNWILYGRIPDDEEFMIVRDKARGFILDSKFLPNLLNQGSAADILEVGLCVSHLKLFEKVEVTSVGLKRKWDEPDEDMALVDKRDYVFEVIREHREILLGMSFPLEAERLAITIASIKESTYKRIVTNVLPLKRIAQVFDMIRKFVLLGSWQWVQCLIDSAMDSALVARNGVPNVDCRRMFRSAVDTFTEDSRSEVDRELGQLVSKLLDMRLAAIKEDTLIDDKFDDILLKTRSKLHFTMQWPFNLFVTASDAQYYSFIFAFLSSFTLTMSNASSLWRHHQRGLFTTAESEQATVAAMKGLSLVYTFLSIIWEYYQRNVIDLHFGELEKLCASQIACHRSDPNAIINLHQQILTRVVERLFIRNFQIRTRLRALFTLSNSTVDALLAGEAPPADADVRLKSIMLSIIEQLEQGEARHRALDMLIAQLAYTIKPPTIASRVMADDSI